MSVLLWCGFVFLLLVIQSLARLVQKKGVAWIHIVFLLLSIIIVTDTARHLLDIITSGPDLYIPRISQEELAPAIVFGLLFLLRGILGRAIR